MVSTAEDAGSRKASVASESKPPGSAIPNRDMAKESKGRKNQYWMDRIEFLDHARRRPVEDENWASLPNKRCGEGAVGDLRGARCRDSWRCAIHSNSSKTIILYILYMLGSL
jgi:hypothetical protein